MRSKLSRWVGGWNPESVALATTLLLALLVRLLRLDSLEPNILPDEADHLTLLFGVLLGRGPGPFDLSWDGNPAASLYPALPFLALLGPSYVALRLSSVLGSMLLLLVYYHLVRQWLSVFSSWAVTVLLAFSTWFLFFSRNGEVNVWVPLYCLSAMLAVRHAIASGRWHMWVVGGAFCGLGWYSYLGGIFILPVLLGTLAVMAVAGQVKRRQALIGGAILTVVTLVMLLPRVPILEERWEAVDVYVGSRAVLRGESPLRWPAILASQLTIVLRAFFLLDPTIEGNSRYAPPGLSLLDPLSAGLFFAGLFLGVRKLASVSFWWLTLAVYLIAVQALSREIPDAARALPALPAMYFFAGLVIEALASMQGVGHVARGLLALAVPVAAFWGWSTYAQWQSRPTNAITRQPAVEIAEYPFWRALQMVLIRTDQQTMSVSDWHEVRHRYIPEESRLRMPRGAASQVETKLLPELAGASVLRRPRGVAVLGETVVFVLQGDGKLLRIETSGSAAPQDWGTGGPTASEVSDLAIGSDGSVYVLDAGRGLIDRYNPNGRFAGSLGRDWGMYRPRGLAIGPDDTLYVADTGHNRVLIARGSAVRETLVDFNQPTDVAVDEQGSVYIVQPEASKLSVLDSDGRPTRSWEIGKANTVDGPHLAVLEQGLLAVTDPPRRRVVLYTANGRELESVGGEGSPALTLPYAVAGVGGQLLVADSGRQALVRYEITVR